MKDRTLLNVGYMLFLICVTIGFILKWVYPTEGYNILSAIIILGLMLWVTCIYKYLIRQEDYKISFLTMSDKLRDMSRTNDFKPGNLWKGKDKE